MVDVKQSKGKETAAHAAADLIQSGMVIGLGSGSTASLFIHYLGARCREGLKIQAVATSKESEQIALAEKIPLLDSNAVLFLDLDVDGADEVDPSKRLIKGGGGALLREKIVARMSREMIVIVDEHKLVQKLGKFPLAVEVSLFGCNSIINHITALGYFGKLRKSGNEPFVTENHNYIFDIHFEELIDNPEELEHQLRTIPGVIETGLFLHMAGRVIVGYEDGHTEILK